MAAHRTSAEHRIFDFYEKSLRHYPYWASQNINREYVLPEIEVLDNATSLSLVPTRIVKSPDAL